MECCDGWFLYRSVIFFCPHCRGTLETCGYINKLLCLKCRCIFLVKVELQELRGPDVDADIRQLSSSSKTEADAGNPGEESLPGGSIASGQSDIPEGYPI
jgi:hypothetical protein